jgi:hypothetical protein
MSQYLVLIGAIVNVLGTSTYVWQTVRGKTKPNRMTFLLWSTAPFIGAIAAFASGVTWPAVTVLVAALCPFSILLASFANRNAYWRLTTLDYVCGALSLVALGSWYATDQPVLAIAFAILSDAFATAPTLVKAWRYPETESALSYFGSAFSALMGIVAARSWTFSAVAFPVYLFLAMGLTGIGAVRRGRVL